MPRYLDPKAALKALKKKFRSQEKANESPNENKVAPKELKWELKEDYGLSDEELSGKSLAQLQQMKQEMQGKRESDLELLQTKTQVPENAARDMPYMKILKHLEQIKEIQGNNSTNNDVYVIQENGKGVVIRRINNNPVQTHNTHQNNPPKILLGNTVTYQWIEISEHTSLNETLLEDHANTNLIKDWSQSAKQQQGITFGSEIELVIGLDFGTTNTKVVIREETRKIAWAVPFNKELEKRYLLKSGVYLEQDGYNLKGLSENLQSNLKTPLVLGELDNNKTPHLIAFLALVIRYSRNWFLASHAPHYRFNKFIWVYNLGIPSAIFNHHYANTEKYVKRLLCQSVMAANKTENTITKASIESLLNEELCEKTQPFCQVIPEIQAQLIGHIESDSYDPGKRRFMIIDIGGGTADTAIVNLTHNSDDGSKTYNCMSSVVMPLGIETLHKERLDWVAMSLDHNPVENPILKEQLKQSGSNFPLEQYPDTVSKYLHDAIFPETFSIDELFYAEIVNKLFDKPINEARQLDPHTYIDHEQPLQFFYCGGGSHHSLLGRLRSRGTHNVVGKELPMPAEVDAPGLDPKYFHRISVAYGLSFDSHGDFIPATEIEFMPEELTATYGNEYPGPEVM